MIEAIQSSKISSLSFSSIWTRYAISNALTITSTWDKHECLYKVAGFYTSNQCFQAVFLYQSNILKFFNCALNFVSQGMVLSCTEVKRFEESMFSCTTREVAC